MEFLSKTIGFMAEMVDATDLKSVDHYDRPGSTPGGTTNVSL